MADQLPPFAVQGGPAEVVSTDELAARQAATLPVVVVDGQAQLVAPDGTPVSVPADQAQALVGQGYLPEQPDQIGVRREQELFERTHPRWISALQGAASGAMLGMADPLIDPRSAERPEFFGGQLAGAIGTAFIPGAAANYLGRGALAAGEAAAAKLGGGALAKAAGMGAAGAAEGALLGGVQQLGALEPDTDTELATSALTRSLTQGALVGGLLGAGGSGLSTATRAIKKRVGDLHLKAVDRATQKFRNDVESLAAEQRVIQKDIDRFLTPERQATLDWAGEIEQEANAIRRLLADRKAGQPLAAEVAGRDTVAKWIRRTHEKGVKVTAQKGGVKVKPGTWSAKTYTAKSLADAMASDAAAIRKGLDAQITTKSGAKLSELETALKRAAAKTDDAKGRLAQERDRIAADIALEAKKHPIDSILGSYLTEHLSPAATGIVAPRIIAAVQSSVTRRALGTISGGVIGGMSGGPVGAVVGLAGPAVVNRVARFLTPAVRKAGQVGLVDAGRTGARQQTIRWLSDQDVEELRAELDQQDPKAEAMETIRRAELLDAPPEAVADQLGRLQRGREYLKGRIDALTEAHSPHGSNDARSLMDQPLTLPKRQLYELSREVAAVEDPATAVDAFADGDLSAGQRHALAAVHPDVLEGMEAMVRDAISMYRKGGYSRRQIRQFNLVLGAESDGGYARRLARYGQQQGPEPPRQTASRSNLAASDVAQNYQTRLQSAQSEVS